MEVNALKSLLRRFKGSDFTGLVDKWSYLGVGLASASEEINVSHSRKKQIIHDIMKIVNVKKVTADDVGELELIYIQMYSKRKIWSVYKVEMPPDKQISQSNPSALCDKLQENLSDYFDADVHLQVEDGTFWLCLRLHSELGRRPAPLPWVVYAMYHTRAPYLIVSAMLARHAPYIIEAFVSSLQCKAIRQLSLKGRCVTSLAQMVLNKESQGAFSQYSSDQLPRNPLAVGLRKRRANESSQPADKRLTCENSSRLTQQHVAVDAAFGPQRLPVLETVNYKMETHFRGALPDMHNTPFRCNVRFEGTDVLEGLRRLASSGLTSVPVKKHLTQISSMARNSFVLRARPTVSVAETDTVTATPQAERP